MMIPIRTQLFEFDPEGQLHYPLLTWKMQALSVLQASLELDLFLCWDAESARLQLEQALL